LVAEEYAIESYTQIINDEDVDISLRNLILEMYYDEIEHLSQFKTLLIAINYGAMMV
jgi:rubrerythrin